MFDLAGVRGAVAVLGTSAGLFWVEFDTDTYPITDTDVMYLWILDSQGYP